MNSNKEKKESFCTLSTLTAPAVRGGIAFFPNGSRFGLFKLIGGGRKSGSGRPFRCIWGLYCCCCCIVADDTTGTLVTIFARGQRGVANFHGYKIERRPLQGLLICMGYKIERRPLLGGFTYACRYKIERRPLQGLLICMGYFSYAFLGPYT